MINLVCKDPSVFAELVIILKVESVNYSFPNISFPDKDHHKQVVYLWKSKNILYNYCWDGNVLEVYGFH